MSVRADRVVYWPVRNLAFTGYETLGYAQNYVEASLLSSPLVNEIPARGYAPPARVPLRSGTVNYGQPRFVFDPSHEAWLTLMSYVGNVMGERTSGRFGCSGARNQPSSKVQWNHRARVLPREKSVIRDTTKSRDGVRELVEEFRHRLLNWRFLQWNLFQFSDDHDTWNLRVNALSPACDRPSGAHSFVSNRVTLNQSASGKMDVRYAVTSDSGALKSRAFFSRRGFARGLSRHMAWLVVRPVRVLLCSFSAVLLGIPVVKAEGRK